MTLPAFFFGSLIALLIGSIFHFIVGGNIKKLILYLVLSSLGFWIGNLVANQFNWNWFPLGIINLGGSLSGAFILMAVGHWLSSNGTTTDSK